MSQSVSNVSSANRAMTANSTPRLYGLRLNEIAPPSVERLGMAFNEICRALSHALQDERDVAEQFVQRAATLLNVNLTLGEPHENLSRNAPISRESTVSRLAPWQQRKVRSYIESGLAETLTVRQIASTVGLSPSHFSRSFKATFDETPHRYVQRLRIELSQGMMLTTTKSMADIAFDCGLADQAHLGRLFRNFVGESPGAWRRARATPLSYE
jgi:AraC family transcriptional regulator